jgi:hypothetical protein
MDEQAIELKRKVLGDIKQFARAEMARDLGRRHGRPLRLPWDAEEAPAGDAAPQDQDLDAGALQELAGMIGGGG